MKKKLEHLAAKLAFEELDAELSQKMREEARDDAELARAVQDYDSLRAGLKMIGQRVPEPTLSTERLRDAILKEGLSARKSASANWNWVWAPVATAVVAFAVVSRMHQTNQLPVGALPNPGTFAAANPPSDKVALNLPTPHSAAPLAAGSKSVRAKVPATFVADNSLAPRTKPSVIGAREFDANVARDLMAVVSSVGPGGKTDGAPVVLAAGGPENFRGTGSAGTTTMRGGGFGGSMGPAPAPAPNSGALVLIEAGTDGETGAPRAKEVESLANISIGG